jgi:4-azaleucine resistance transporter AzlC
VKAASPISYPHTRLAASAAGWALFRKGLWRSLPISVGYFPISLAFGLAAEEMGMPGWAAVLMSITTFGGAAQMVAMSLLGTGQGIFTVVVAVFVINSRFFLLAMALTEKISHWPPFRKILFGSYLSDESFALLVAGNGLFKKRFRSMECLGLVLGPMVVWVLATCIGFSAAERIGEVKSVGLDFALVALLLAVLSTQIRTPSKLVVAVVAAAISLVCHSLDQSTLAILAATLLAPVVGLWLQTRLWSRRRRNMSVVTVPPEGAGRD